MYTIMLNALKNEVAIDTFYIKSIYPDKKINIPIIRPAITMIKVKNLFLLKLLLYILVLLWVVLFPLILIYKFIHYLRLLNTNHSFSVDKKIVIATSHRIQDVYKGVNCVEKPVQFLLVPWIKIDKINFNEKQKIELLSILDIRDLIFSFYYSFISLFLWAKNIKHPFEILQTYVLFEYFMMQKCLSKLDQQGVQEYWYSNHYDRWAVLFDGTKKKNVLLQHGFIDKNFKLPYKMKNLKTIYYIDKASIQKFKNNILDRDAKTKFLELQSTLHLENIQYAYKSIFLISVPAQYEFDVKLVERLANLDIIVYIKPHPLYDTSMYIKSFQKNSKCILIEDKNYYPNIDLIISGYSTLAFEYELLGKQIIWIPHESLESIKEKIIKYKGETENVQK